ncbi:MAG TPA: succinylglutamate desuccinylase/aspartoacylase family protein [Syntrophomonadaceae bacterium]|nr:succinylglutamate desuccinylase/aspartoacylase family protein [Syntrophomonadaceae bacterium]
MNKIRIRPSKFLTILLLTVFAMTTILISPQAVEALTVKYSSPVEYSVTTYEQSSSNLDYQPTTELVAGRPYTYYTVTASSEETEQKPTVQEKTIAPDTKYATNLYIIESGKPGPVVMIVGGVHGNETAGYLAAEKFRNYSLKKGTLLVLPQANKLAVGAGKRYAVGESDLNRLFPQSSSSSPSGPLAKDIYNVVKEYKVDWLMDMHEGFDYYKNSSTSSVGQSLIYYPAKGTISTVEDIVSDLNKGIKTSLRKFSILRYPVKGSLARSTAEYLGVKSFIFETSMKQTLSVRVNFQQQAANKLLRNLGMY